MKDDTWKVKGHVHTKQHSYPVPCPYCNGYGVDMYNLECDYCDGTGEVEE